jgi:uncharacterized protein (DUF302 family)
MLERNDLAGNWREIAGTFDDALARLPEALKTEGFGVVSEIDLQATFKAKLSVDFRRYRIIGACNPGLAHQAVNLDPRIGVLLPCNVVLYETDQGKVVMGAVDPMQTLGGQGHAEALAPVAADVRGRLERVLARMQ